MRFSFPTLTAIVLFAFQPASGESPDPAKTASPDGKTVNQAAPVAPSPKADPFDFSDNARSKSEDQQYLDLDESIKIRVEPIIRSAVVDRVVEKSTVYVRAPGSSRVEIYVEPVDSPFCGKSIGEPRKIGQSTDGRRNFPIVWSDTETNRYVKVYAKAHKPDGQTGRSRSIDLCMGGMRFQAAPATP